MSRFVASVTEYQSNNRGKVPTNWEDFRDTYLGGTDGFSGPNNEYTLITGKCTSGANAACSVTGSDTTTTPGDERVFIFTNAACVSSSVSNEDPTMAVKSASPDSSQTLDRKVAVVLRMEGSGVLYCNTN